MLACYGALPPCFPFMFFFRGMPKGVGEPGGFFMGICPLIPLVCYFSLLRQRKVTKRKASPARTAVLSGRHVDAGFSARPPPTLRIGPAPDGARASHERAPALRSVPPAVFWCGCASLPHGWAPAAKFRALSSVRFSTSPFLLRNLYINNANTCQVLDC